MPFSSSIQGWSKQPSIIELENLLSNQEALENQMTNNKPSVQVEEVLYSRDQGKRNYSAKQIAGGSVLSNDEGQSKGTARTYFRCGKHGHFKCDCQVKVICNRCGKSGHIQSNCRVNLSEEDANAAYESNESEQPNWEQCLAIETIDQAANVYQTNAPTDVAALIDYNTEWIVDSGCSHHATGNVSLLFDVRPHCGKKAIVTADNSLHLVVKKGYFKIKESNSNDGGISLKDVYHVPGLKKNLASVSQIADSGRYVIFGPDDVKILSNLKHIEADVLFAGKRKESLYVLSASNAYVEKTGQNASATLWHARLGHVGYQLLQQISTKKLLDGVPLFKEIQHDVVCPGC